MTSWRDVPGFWGEAEAADQADLLSRLPPHGQAVELGTWCGRSALCAVEFMRGTGSTDLRYVTVDAYPSNAVEEQHEKITSVEAKAKATEVLAPHTDLVTVIHSDAVDAARHWDRGPIDLLIVDDLHTPDHVAAVLKWWTVHLANGALVAFHDWNHKPYELEPTIERWRTGSHRVFVPVRLGALLSFQYVGDIRDRRSL